MFLNNYNFFQDNIDANIKDMNTLLSEPYRKRTIIRKTIRKTIIKEVYMNTEGKKKKYILEKV